MTATVHLESEGKTEIRGRNEPTPQLDIRIARSFDDLMAVFAVRSIVFVNEQSCPYHEEFDGNDHVATHVLATVDGEPVGTARIRFFGQFAKVERVAVRQEHRSSRLAFKIARYAFDFCRRKGFTTIYGQPERRLVPFWRFFGAEELPAREELVFSDREYQEMVLRLEPHESEIGLQSSSYVLNRPEGEWDQPGILDHSSTRPAVNRDPAPRHKKRQAAQEELVEAAA
jgi:predicted GNAT family N-acyltransferase